MFHLEGVHLQINIFRFLVNLEVVHMSWKYEMFITTYELVGNDDESVKLVIATLQKIN
jgi:hypothetical protein